MLFFILVISYSLKYIYVRVYLLVLDLVVLYSFVAAWVFYVLLCVDPLMYGDFVHNARCWATDF
jgi:hypothetical protein